MYSIGFPKMHKEAGEVRDFLPALIHKLAPLAYEIVLEEKYGSGMGIEPDQYTTGCTNVRFATNRECYDQDIVVQIRAPEDDELSRLKPGTLFFAMFHYPTHPGRVELLDRQGTKAISMDSVIDDGGKRLIEHLRGTSWNAMGAGFRLLQKSYAAFDSPTRKPIDVVIIGVGAIGRFAAEAATKYGDIVLHQDFLERGVPGVIVHVLGRNITRDEKVVRELFENADMLVDASFRSDPTKHIIRNELIGVLPGHAVIVDITADPYIAGRGPTQVKGLEGIPSGDLDKYEFWPDDPAFDQLPLEVEVKHRRATASCYSWPGLKPVECMQFYSEQMVPILEILLEVFHEGLSLDSKHYLKRALYRGSLKHYLESCGCSF